MIGRCIFAVEFTFLAPVSVSDETVTVATANKELGPARDQPRSVAFFQCGRKPLSYPFFRCQEGIKISVPCAAIVVEVKDQ